MHLSKVIINGFKSFADKVEINFNPGLSAIVGPNGCGKSNIYEAILWVLGEQRPSSLRSAKMEEVIFSGTIARPPVGMAEVTLFLSDEERKLSDKTELKITRRLFRSGESEYLINNEQVRLRDIVRLMTKIGLGKNTYAFIGQGEVNDIIKARPQDLRLMFEEAAGIAEYKNQKFTTEAQLHKNTDNVLRVGDLINEVEKDCQRLQARALKAAEHKQLREELATERQLLLSRKFAHLQSNISQIEKDNVYKREEIADREREIVSGQGKAHLLQVSYDELLEAVRNNQAELIRSEARQEIVRQRIQSITENIAGEKADLEHSRQEMTSIDEYEKQALENQNTATNNKILWENEIISIKEKIDDINIQLRDQEEEFAKADYDRSLTEYNDLRLEKQSLLAEESLILANRESNIKLQADNLIRQTNLNKNFQDISEQIANKQNELDALLDKISLTTAEMANQVAVEREILPRLSKLKTELANTEKELQQKQNTLLLYQRQESEYSGYYQGIRFLMNAARDSAPETQGLIGPVADLVEVSEELRLAISEALGSRAQFLICKKSTQALEMINLLKRDRAGKASFLPLDSLQYQMRDVPQSLLNAAGFIGRASEMVGFNEDIRAAVEQLLGNILIFIDSETALKHQKKENGFLLVTLDGEIFYPGGVISGGKLHNPSQQILSRKSQIAELSEDIEKDKTVLDEIIHLVQELELDSQKVTLAISEAKDEQSRLESRKYQLNSDIELLKAKHEDVVDRLQEIELSLNHSNALEEQYADRLQAITKTIEGQAAVYTEVETVLVKHRKLTEANNELQQLRHRHEMRIELLENNIAQQDLLNVEYRNSLMQLSERRSRLSSQQIESERVLNALILDKESAGKEVESLEEERMAILDRTMSLEQESRLLQAQLERMQLSEEELHSSNVTIENQLRQNEMMLIELKSDRKHLEAECYRFGFNLPQEDLGFIEVNIAQVQESEIRVADIEKRLAQLGDADMSAILDLEQKQERLAFLKNQQHDLIETQERLQELISKVDKICIQKLGDTIEAVRVNFKRIFNGLFRGGSCDIHWEMADNIFESGVSLHVSPPGKNVRNMNQLSGGEKALTAIALLLSFAGMSDSAFCIFDEVDASLDDANKLLLVNYLVDISKDTQVLTITHSGQVMAKADELFGVVMQEKGVSKVIEVTLKQVG